MNAFFPVKPKNWVEYLIGSEVAKYKIGYKDKKFNTLFIMGFTTKNTTVFLEYYKEQAYLFVFHLC